MGYGSPAGKNPSIYFGPGGAVKQSAVRFDLTANKKQRKRTPKKKNKGGRSSKLSNRVELDVFRSDLDKLVGDSPKVLTVGTHRYAFFHLHALPNWTSGINISMVNNSRQAIIEIKSPKGMFKPSSVAQSPIRPGTVIYEKINEWKKEKLVHSEDSIMAEIILNLPFSAEMQTSDDIHEGNNRFVYHDFTPPGCDNANQLTMSQKKFVSVLFVFKEYQDNFRVSRKVEGESSFIIDSDDDSY